jgi:hypothetical protein
MFLDPFHLRDLQTSENSIEAASGRVQFGQSRHYQSDGMHVEISEQSPRVSRANALEPGFSLTRAPVAPISLKVHNIELLERPSGLKSKDAFGRL